MFNDYIEVKNLSLEKCLEDQFTLNSNRFLLETLVSNLLTNAIRHNLKNGSISIELINQTLIIKNSGNLPLNTDNLFKRFSVSASGSTNSGLGLAIVKEICDRSLWTASYSFENSQHVFSIKF
ncbi:putative sensor-like histidine kinase YedV [compost metagenome]